MAKGPRKRQQKLERRAAKRKEKKHLLNVEQNAGLGQRLIAATKYPPLHAWITEDLWKQGLGWVLLSRLLPTGQVAVAVFLVDRYCLGVKNALVQIVHRADYESVFVHKMQSEFTSRAVSPADARKLVEAAVEYARGLGFAPHADYHQARLLFGDVDASAATEEFEFGQDGKPYFIAGPNDTPSRCRQILDALLRHCGPDNFHYLMPLGDPDVALPEAIKNRAPIRVVGENAKGELTDSQVDFGEK